MPGRCRGDLVGTTWKGLDCAEIPYQFKPWQIEAHNHMKSMAQTLYKSRIPPYRELQEIKSKIDIEVSACSQSAKDKVEKIGGSITLL